MADVKARVQQILATKQWSQSELSRRAELTRTHVSGLLKGPSDRVAGETLAKIARAAGVSLRWLQTGEGTPDEIALPPALTVEYDERYPNRAEAVRRMRGVVSDAAIERVKGYSLNAPSDPTVEEWVRDLLDASRDIARGVRVGRTLDETDEQAERDRRAAAVAKLVQERAAAAREPSGVGTPGTPKKRSSR